MKREVGREGCLVDCLFVLTAEVCVLVARVVGGSLEQFTHSLESSCREPSVVE